MLALPKQNMILKFKINTNNILQTSMLEFWYMMNSSSSTIYNDDIEFTPCNISGHLDDCYLQLTKEKISSIYVSMFFFCTSVNLLF